LVPPPAAATIVRHLISRPIETFKQLASQTALNFLENGFFAAQLVTNDHRGSLDVL
jgi:hypothetical protein